MKRWTFLIGITAVTAAALVALAGGSSNTYTYSLTSGDPEMSIDIPNSVRVTVQASTPGVRCMVKVFSPEDRRGSGVRNIRASGDGTVTFNSASIINSNPRDYLVRVTPVVTANAEVYRRIKNGGSIEVSVAVNWQD